MIPNAISSFFLIAAKFFWEISNVLHVLTVYICIRDYAKCLHESLELYGILYYYSKIITIVKNGIIVRFLIVYGRCVIKMYIYEKISTGHTSGKVISTNASVTIGGVTFTNLTSADYSSAPGDSGCIVYSYISSTNTRLTLGIHKASDGTTRYYVKANQINSALGTSRY